MKASKTAAVFAIVSAIYWMLASMIQYQAFAALFDHTPGRGSILVAVIGTIPVVIYSLICLAFFRRLERRAGGLADPKAHRQAN